MIQFYFLKIASKCFLVRISKFQKFRFRFPDLERVLPRTGWPFGGMYPELFFEHLFQSDQSRNDPIFLSVTVPYLEKALDSDVLWYSSAPVVGFIDDPTGVVWTGRESAACNSHSAPGKGYVQKLTSLKGRFVVSKVQDAHGYISQQRIRVRLNGDSPLGWNKQTLTLTLRRAYIANENRGRDITRSLTLAGEWRQRFHVLLFDAYQAAVNAKQDTVAGYLSTKYKFLLSFSMIHAN